MRNTPKLDLFLSWIAYTWFKLFATSDSMIDVMNGWFKVLIDLGLDESDEKSNKMKS